MGFNSGFKGLESDTNNAHVWTLTHIAAGVSCLTCEIGFPSEPEAFKTKL